MIFPIRIKILFEMFPWEGGDSVGKGEGGKKEDHFFERVLGQVFRWQSTIQNHLLWLLTAGHGHFSLCLLFSA